MTNRKRWSRATVAVVFSVMTILGATACYAWIQQERATNEARRAYAVAQNYTAQPYGSGLSLQNAPAQANYSLTPNASSSVSFAKVVHNSLPLEQHTLVKLIRSTPKEGNTEKKTEARDQLMRLVEQELVGRLLSQEAELRLLEKRITEAKEKLAQRVARKNEIVERRMAELLAEPDDLAWNADINVPNANTPQLSPLLSLPIQPSSLQPSSSLPPLLSAPQNANPAVGPAASPGNGTPLNATATLLEEAIDLESEFEELDGFSPEGKIEAVQRLAFRKRIRKLELGLEAAMKRTEIDCRLLSSSLDLARKEYDFSEQEFVNTNELYMKGAASNSQFKTHELKLEQLKQKVTNLEQELEVKSDGEKSVSERIQTLRKKMDDILEVQKPAPEANY